MVKTFTIKSRRRHAYRVNYEEELNEEQLKVVMAEGGPMLVIAGAGSGKTRTLTYRVSRLIEDGTAFMTRGCTDENGEGEDGDGVLRAWEIVQDLRLDADLVTLAACDTARGDEVGGEGVMGLAWAFQYAGARAQLGSLWRVPDRSTCLLMRRFYAALDETREPDEALRRARSSLAGPPGGGSRAGDLRHPYHWAGFTVLGDAFR